MRRAIDPNLKYITIQLKYNNVNQDITFNTESDYGVCISTLAMKLPIVNGKICEKLALFAVYFCGDSQEPLSPN